MNAVGVAFLVIASILMFALPRRLAILPLLLSMTYMTYGQVIDIGPAHFTIVRLLVVVGFLRALTRGEHVAGGMHTVDKLLLAWAAVLIGTSAFHTSDAWVYRMGIVWTELGCYFLFRIFMRDLDDVRSTFRFMCVAMLPLALLMLVEKATQFNAFGFLGGVSPHPIVRDGHVRATGPFSHPILAGTVGVTCVAMALSVRKTHPWSFRAGLLAGAGIVVAATSSGPIMMLGFVVAAMAARLLRHHMAALRWSVVAGLLALSAAMNDPIYFLMARIDITGGSQGYFRAQLIRSSIGHLSEWWASGTDYTRHWMSSGIHANSRHTDITNHFLAMGVMGGLPLMIIFVAILIFTFRDVGVALRQRAHEAESDQQFVWLLGALLFGFFMNFWSISLFDQSVAFYYLTIAGIQCVLRNDAVAAGKATPRREVATTGDQRAWLARAPARRTKL